MDRLPNLPDRYDRHLLLGCKGYGACNTLTGKILLTMIMVDDDCSSWTDAALDAYKAEQTVATEKMQQDAKEYGVALTVATLYLRCKIDGGVDMKNFNDYADKALRAVGFSDREQLSSHLKRTYCVKEAPVFFCVNYPGRSFAIEWNQGDYFEYGVLYSEHADYRHELYHLFGAADFYYPEAVDAAAEKYFPNSIMRVNEYAVVDNLTAYLIGWTDCLDPGSRSFLDETAWVDQAYIDRQRKQQTHTGYGTIRWGDGTYTGDLVADIPNGNGRIVWDDGNTYEGQWKNGCGNGYGTLRWNTHNCSYAGHWADWKMHGYGTYTYDDGTICSGLWENGEFVG